MAQNEHEEAADALNNADPNEEYQEEVVVDEPDAEEVPPGHLAAEEETSEEEPAEEVPAYEADYSFNVRGEKKEFDDWAKPLVVDKETEEHYRGIMAKVHGIEAVQESRDKYKNQYEEIQPEFTRITSDLGKLAHYRDTGNMKAFQETLGLKDEAILQRAQEILNYNEMDPAQRQAFDQQQNMGVQQYDLAQQNQNLQNAYHQQQVEFKNNEINLTLMNPQVNELAQSFDQRMGREGAFKEEIWNRGRYHAMVNKVEITTQQAVDEVLQMVGAGDLNAPQAPTQTPAPQGFAQPAAAPPTIPKVSGSGQSPARPVVKSIADLRARRQDMFGS